MIKHKEHFHGSDLEKIELQYGIKKEEVINFGANVNPLGLSSELKQFLAQNLDVIAAYPDREYTALRKAIADCSFTKPEYITVGNGATELISLLIQCLQPVHTLLLSPTYSEYEREISLAGGQCSHFFLTPESDFIPDLDALNAALTFDTDLFILCNPNNPTSSFIANDTMSLVLDICKEKNITVIVDETYAEFAANYPRSSSVSLIDGYDNLIVLRGTSKFFAAPGLRLGYMLTKNTALLSFIRKNQNPWSVNSLADLAGQFMFHNASYIESVRALIETERNRVFGLLSSINGLRPFKPYANFILVKIKKPGMNADLLFDIAIRQNMMIRNCADFPSLDNTYFRFCFMTPEENNRLIECIREAM